MSTVMVTGQTAVSLYFEAIRTSTGQLRDGTLETAIAYNTGGLKINYTRERSTIVTAVTAGSPAPVTLANAGVGWTQYGFIHVGEGLYRVDYPDAAFATGVKFMTPTVTGPSDTKFIFVGLVENVGSDPRSATAADVNVVSHSAGALTNIAAAVWNALTAGLTTAASIGKLLVDNITASILAVKSKTDNLPSDPADASDIAALLATLQATANTINSLIDTEIATIMAKTNLIPANPASEITLATVATYVDTEMAAVKLVTDRLNTALELSGSNYRFTLAALANVGPAVSAEAAVSPLPAKIESINDVQVVGAGTSLDPWRPA